MKMFRPLLILGTFAIGLVIFSWLLRPSLSSSPLGVVISLAVLALGGYAILYDMRALWKDISQAQKVEPDQDSEDVKDN